MVVVLDPISTPTLIDLTTLARVKVILGLGSETKYDTFLASAIKSISKRFEKYLDRGITVASRIEYFDVLVGRKSFDLYAFPVVFVTSVKNDSLRTFGTGTELDPSVYTPSSDNQNTSPDGLLLVDRTRLTSGPRTLQVNYSGGMAATTDEFVALYPDIAEKADLQVAFIHKRRTTLPTASVAEGGASVGLDPWELLPETKDTLNRYRRIPIAV